MAVTKAKKNEVLASLIENMKGAKSVGFAQTNKLTVKEFEALRNDLRTVNTSYHLAKKTLIKIAVKEVFNIEIDLEMLPAQIGVICSNDDSIAGLSKTQAYMTRTFDKKAPIQKVTWAACIFEGKLNGLEETQAIASMPSRETLLGRLVGSMQAPLASMARFFDAAAKDMEEKGAKKLSDLSK